MIPFFVLPPKGVARAAVAYLANTFTCQVYANYRRPEFPDDAPRQATILGRLRLVRQPGHPITASRPTTRMSMAAASICPRGCGRS